MYSFLPDELLKEILAPALQVPDDSFACVGGRSPFSNYTPTTSAYLLVCKDWLRVATPLLYSVVVLRSKAQIQALDSAIMGTPVLAEFIKKLRIESGYCPSLLKILKGAKNLTDLCVSLEVYSSDNVSGFCKGLAFVQPSRLIICDHHRYTKPFNQKTQDLVKVLQDYVSEWPLTNISLSWPLSRWNQNVFTEAVLKNMSIQTITVRIAEYIYTSPTWFKELPSKLPNLKKVIVMADFLLADRFPEFTRMMEAEPRLKSLLECRKNAYKARPTGVNHTSVSTLQVVPSKLSVSKGIATFPDAVWNDILFYALDLPELEDIDPPQLYRPIEHTRFRRGLTFVCKKFHELVIPLYYRCIVITRGAELSSLNTLISRNREIGKQIRTFHAYGKYYDSEDMHQLLASTPNLHGVSNTCGPSDSFDIQALTTLAQCAGASLTNLSIQIRRPTLPKTTEFIYQFTALKHLDVSSSAVFTYEELTVEKKNAFLNLESVSCAMSNSSFLLLLSILHLPKIQRASFPSMEKCDGVVTFLRKHGHKLSSLECGFLPGICVFDTCANLTLFEVPREKPGFVVAEFFYTHIEHPLETIHVKTRDVSRGAEREKFRYLAGLDLSNFKSLQKIQVDKCLWPTTENEIKKSHWVVWAERLQELYGVNIVTESDQKWVPRLRARNPR